MRRARKGALLTGAFCLISFVLAGCSHSTSSPSSGKAVAASTVCPLTGTPAPNGVPARPALAVKIDNYVEARPQTGLNQADVVFEELVEGGITRFVAVYQCQSPSLVGPVRSAREVDVDILSDLGDPIFVHAGGIDPVLALLQKAPIHDINLLDNMSLGTLNRNRIAPYNLYVYPSKVWAMFSGISSPPPFLFAYGSLPQNVGTPVTQVAAPMSDVTNVSWVWNEATQSWDRYYGSEEALDSSGNPISFKNVVIEQVQISYGPYVEDINGSHEVLSQMIGSGKAYVLTQGRIVPCTWSRPSLTAPTSYSLDGKPMELSPGNTWVELQPSTEPVTYSTAVSSQSS